MDANEQKLTPWFPPEVKPARPGWYQRDWKDKDAIVAPDYFDGQNWFIGSGNGTRSTIPSIVNRPWRGLAEPPLTDWFDADTKPVREGVYEINANDSERRFACWTPAYGWGATYKAWTGERSVIDRVIDLAHLGRDNHGEFAVGKRWRGLAVQP